MDDLTFNRHFEAFIAIIRDEVGSGAQQRFPETVYLVDHRGEVEIREPQRAEVTAGDDRYSLFHDFGALYGPDRPLPLAVYTAAESGNATQDCIVVTGCTTDGRTCGAQLALVRPSAGGIRLGRMVICPYRGESRISGRIAAEEVLAGWHKGRKTKSWWRRT